MRPLGQGTIITPAETQRILDLQFRVDAIQLAVDATGQREDVRGLLIDMLHEAESALERLRAVSI